MAFFIIGCIAFLIVVIIQISMWDYADELSPFFMWALALITLYFYSYGNLIFSDNPYKWILFSAAFSILALYLIYTIYYCFTVYFEFWIFWFVPPATLEIIFIINTFYKINLTWLVEIQAVVNRILIVGAALIILTTIFYVIYRWGSSNKERELNSILYKNELYKLSLFNKDISKIRLIGTDQQELDSVLNELYIVLKSNDEKVNRRYLSYFSISSEIKYRIKVLPEDAQDLIEERLQYMDFYKTTYKLGLSEFKSLLFPEYYGHSPNETQSVQQRILEELPSKVVKLISQNMIVNSDAKINQTRDLFQSQMRQLFHSLMTPIMAVENSIKLINISREDEDYYLIIGKELPSIENSFKLVKSLLYAYRRVAMMDFSDDNTSINISTQIKMTVDSLNRQHKKNCLLEINGQFEKLDGFASELIIALLVPLLQNAVEASPSEGQITLSEIISLDHIIIEVSNNSVERVDNQILQSDGKSSKEMHEGLGLSSVRSIASQMQVDFSISSTGYQVTARLAFPIRKKELFNKHEFI